VRLRTAARLLAIGTFAVVFAGFDTASSRSFALHMTQHTLLMVVLAPLIVLGWAPQPAPSWMRGRSFAAGAVVAQIAALVLWHIPAVFDGAAAHVPLHAVEHLTLIAAAIATWWVILASPVAPPTRFAVCAVVAASMLLLGIALTFAPTPWYAVDAANLSDQQLGGALMWGPGGLAYVVAAGWLIGRAIVDDERLVLSRRG
jgi:putative membrane protein